MRYSLKDEGVVFILKVNSNKKDEKMIRQLQLYIDKAMIKCNKMTNHIGKWHCIAEMGYVDDDFPRNRYSLKLIFTPKPD